MCWYLASHCQGLKSATYWVTAPCSTSFLCHLKALTAQPRLSCGMWQSWYGWTWQLCWIKPWLWPPILNYGVFFFLICFKVRKQDFHPGGGLPPTPFVPFLKACEKAVYFCGFIITSCQADIISVGGTSLADVYRRLWLLLCQTPYWCVAHLNETVQKAGSRLTIVTLLTSEHSKMLMMCLFLQGRRTIWLTSSKFLG